MDIVDLYFEENFTNLKHYMLIGWHHIFFWSKLV